MSDVTTTFRPTEAAVSRIAALLESEDGPYFRVRIDAGGCNGFQYHFDFDDKRADDDAVVESGDIKILVDEASLPFLDGAELDFVEELGHSYFEIKNPNAASSCGCGTSFSI